MYVIICSPSWKIVVTNSLSLFFDSSRWWNTPCRARQPASLQSDISVGSTKCIPRVSSLWLKMQVRSTGALLMNLVELKDVGLHSSILAGPFKMRRSVDLFTSATRKRPCTTHFIRPPHGYLLIVQICPPPTHPTPSLFLSHWSDKVWAQSSILNNSIIPKNGWEWGNRFVESMTHCTGFWEGALDRQCRE